HQRRHRRIPAALRARARARPRRRREGARLRVHRARLPVPGRRAAGRRGAGGARTPFHGLLRDFPRRHHRHRNASRRTRDAAGGGGRGADGRAGGAFPRHLGPGAGQRAGLPGGRGGGGRQRGRRHRRLPLRARRFRQRRQRGRGVHAARHGHRHRRRPRPARRHRELAVGPARPRDRQQGRAGAGGGRMSAPGAADDDAAQDASRIAAALDDASRDPALPAPTRELLARAGDALRAAHSEAEAARLRYHALFDAVPDPVSILDERGIVLDLNRAGMAAYRRPRDEIVGQPIEVLNPDLPRDHMAPVLESLNRGETYVIEVANMRGDGTRFPVEVHSAGFVHDGRRCVVAVARDLSARRMAELRYGQLLEVLDKGVLVLDGRGRLVQANAAAMRILGTDGHPDFQAWLDPADWTMVDEAGRPIAVADLPPAQTLRTGRATDSCVVGLYHRPERRLRWLSVSSVPLFAPGGRRPLQVLSFFSDVTELKRDSALFDRAQSLAHIGGWEWEVDRDALYMTDEARRILGDRPVQAIADLLDALVHEDRARLEQALRRAADER